MRSQASTCQLPLRFWLPSQGGWPFGGKPAVLARMSRQKLVRPSSSAIPARFRAARWFGLCASGFCAVSLLAACGGSRTTPPETSAVYADLPPAEPIALTKVSTDEPEPRAVSPTAAAAQIDAEATPSAAQTSDGGQATGTDTDAHQSEKPAVASEAAPASVENPDAAPGGDPTNEEANASPTAADQGADDSLPPAPTKADGAAK